MPNDHTATANVLSLTSLEGKPRTKSAGASRRDRAAADRDLMRERFGTPNYTPVPPIELSEAAKRHWDAAVKALPLAQRRAGVEDALMRYSVAMATYEMATMQIERNGLLARGRAGEAVKSPMLSIRTSAAVAIREARHELGLPAAYRGKAKS